MKNFTLSLFFVLISGFVYGQCPTTNIVLSTQSDVDNFADNYPNCTALTHELKIDGSINSITNLNGLSQIISTQKLFIFNTDIVDLSDLDNLEDAVHLAIWGNQNMQDLTGLNSLQSIGFMEVFVNSNLTSLNGMPNLSSLDNISIFQIDQLTSNIVVEQSFTYYYICSMYSKFFF